jgi:chromosome segregation ATPase
MGKSERISNLENGFKHLKEEGNNQKEGLKNLNGILQSLQSKLKSIEEISHPQESNKTAVKAGAEQDTTQKLAEQEKKLKAQEQKIQKLEAKIDKLMQFQEMQLSAESSIEEKVNHQIKQVTDSMSSIQHSLDEQADKAEALDALSNRMAHFEKRLEELYKTGSFNHGIEELVTTLQEQIAELAVKNPAIEDQLEALDSLKVLPADFAGLQKDISDIKEKQSTILQKVQKEEAKTVLNEEKIELLETAFQSISELETHIQDTQHHLKSMPDNFNSKLKRICTELEERLQGQDMLSSKLEEQISELSKHDSTLEARLESFDCLKPLPSKFDALEKQITDLLEKQSTLSERVRKGEANGDFQEEKIAALEKELQRITEVESQLKNIQLHFDSFAKVIETRFADIGSFNNELEEKLQDHHSYFMELQEKVTHLSGKSKALEAQLDSVKHLRKMEQDIGILQKDLAELSENQNTLSERVQKEALKGNILEEKVKDLGTIRSAAEEAALSLREMSHELQMNSTSISNLNTILTSHQTALDLLKREFINHEQFLNGLGEELAVQKLAITNLTKNEQSFTEEIRKSLLEKINGHDSLLAEIQHVLEHLSFSETAFREEIKTCTQNLEKGSLESAEKLQMFENDYKKMNLVIEELMEKIEALEKQIRKHKYAHYNSRTR